VILPSLDWCVSAYRRAFQNPFEGGALFPQLVIEPPLDEIQRELGESLPSDMLAIIRGYDFSQLSVGQVMFEYQEHYRRLIVANLPGALAWFGGNHRPEHLLWVADTTAWSILTSTTTGAIHALDRSIPTADYVEVSPSFDLFVRLCCMIAVDVEWLNQLTAVEMADWSKSSFWRQLKSGHA
jgi:hypothetical protein